MLLKGQPPRSLRKAGEFCLPSPSSSPSQSVQLLNVPLLFVAILPGFVEFSSSKQLRLFCRFNMFATNTIFVLIESNHCDTLKSRHSSFREDP